MRSCPKNKRSSSRMVSIPNKPKLLTIQNDDTGFSDYSVNITGTLIIINEVKLMETQLTKFAFQSIPFILLVWTAYFIRVQSTKLAHHLISHFVCMQFKTVKNSLFSYSRRDTWRQKQYSNSSTTRFTRWPQVNKTELMQLHITCDAIERMQPMIKCLFLSLFFFKHKAWVKAFQWPEHTRSTAKCLQLKSLPVLLWYNNRLLACSITEQAFTIC